MWREGVWREGGREGGGGGREGGGERERKLDSVLYYHQQRWHHTYITHVRNSSYGLFVRDASILVTFLDL